MNTDPRSLYLDLLKKTLSFSLWPEPPIAVDSMHLPGNRVLRAMLSGPAMLFEKLGLRLVRQAQFDETDRLEGKIWPSVADTMIGLKRLDNLQFCLESVLRDQVPGDFIETGVWRGGSCIFARAVFAAHGVLDRRVWVADSFAGLPPPDVKQWPADQGDELYRYAPVLAISKEAVENNFRRYGMLDDQVVFLEGWFKDTLPMAPIERLAVLRLDGDMYGSTMDALNALYPKLSPGGYCIVDDYALTTCEKAVEDYRRAHSITEPIEKIDWTGAYWRRR